MNQQDRSRTSSFNGDGNSKQDGEERMEIGERGQKALLTIHGDDYDGKVRADERKRKTGYIRRVYIQKGGRCSARTKSMSRMRKSY